MMTEKKILIILPFALLLISSIYSYALAEWGVDEYGRWEMLGRVDFLKCGLDYIALFIVLYLAGHSTNRSYVSNKFPILFPLLFLAVIFWTVLTIAKDGLIATIYTSGSPLSYLTIYSIYVGADDKSWKVVNRIAPIFATIYVLLAIFPYMHMKGLEDINSIAGNNPITYFMITSFWWMSIASIEITHKSIYYKLWIILLIAVCAFLAFSLTLRSWMIQTALLFILVVWQFNVSKLLKVILATVMVIAVLLCVKQIAASSEMQDEVDAFNEKLTEDTRSQQYENLFDAVPFNQWILGGGMNASYTFNGVGNYKHIDNQYLLLLFRYGILLAIPWISLWLIILFKRKEKRERVVYDRSAAYVVILWLMALGGLSVYNAIIVNPQNILLAMVLGRVLYQKII